jgi:hypothetical protein
MRAGWWLRRFSAQVTPVHIRLTYAHAHVPRETTGPLVRSDSLRFAPRISGCPAVKVQLNCYGRWGARVEVAGPVCSSVPARSRGLARKRANSIWSCPACSAKIRNHRVEEIVCPARARRGGGW